RASRGGRRSGWLAAAVALVLGVGTGGGVIWWMFSGANTPTEVAAVTSPAPAPSAVAPAPAPPAPPVRHDLGPPEQAFASDVQIVDRPDALPRIADSDPVEPSSAQPTP